MVSILLIDSKRNGSLLEAELVFGVQEAPVPRDLQVGVGTGMGCPVLCVTLESFWGGLGTPAH